MSVKTLMTALADKVRALTGAADTYSIEEMTTALGGVKDGVDGALLAIGERGVDIPDDATVSSLVNLIGEIPASTVISEDSCLDHGGKYLVRVIDYDGRIIKEDHLDQGAVFILPPDPVREGLVFEGWVSPVAITDASVTVDLQDIIIGALYRTESGATELDIVVTANTLSSGGGKVSLTLTGMTSVDWGDGTTNSQTSHTYASKGAYTIKIYGATTLTNIGASASLRRARLASTVTSIGTGAFEDCMALEYVSMPASVTSIGGSAFHSCSSLKALTVPSGVVDIGASVFNYCSSMKSVALPSGITSVGDGGFRYCYSLEAVSFTAALTSVGTNAFANCRTLVKIYVAQVASFGDTAFADCASLLEVYLYGNGATIATGGEEVFDGCGDMLEVIVKGISLSGYKDGTNWSDYDYVFTSGGEDKWAL